MLNAVAWYLEDSATSVWMTIVLSANTVAGLKLRVLFPEALRIAKSKFSERGTKNYPNITIHKLGSSQGSS